MIEYTDREKALFGDLYEIECILAEALGYTYDEEYGWATGDHTAVSLAMEAAKKLKEVR